MNVPTSHPPNRLFAGASRCIPWLPPSAAQSLEKSVKGRHMARALLGHISTSADRYLIEEVARLRGRIRELEAELAELKASNESHQLLDELHRITASASESALA
jgi:transcription elongation GreA/GreB family factor